jgi:hypothetical protein
MDKYSLILGSNVTYIDKKNGITIKGDAEYTQKQLERFHDLGLPIVVKNEKTDNSSADNNSVSKKQRTTKQSK